jgi:hypothetical protein
VPRKSASNDLAGVIADRGSGDQPIGHALARIEAGDLFLDRHARLPDHADRAEPVRRRMTLLSQHDLFHAGPIHPAFVVGVAREDGFRRGGHVRGDFELHGRPS